MIRQLRGHGRWKRGRKRQRRKSDDDVPGPSLTQRRFGREFFARLAVPIPIGDVVKNPQSSQPTRHRSSIAGSTTYDTTQSFDQHPNSAIREIDVSAYRISADADEVDSLPGSYVEGMIDGDNPTTRMYRDNYYNSSHRHMIKNAAAYAASGGDTAADFGDIRMDDERAEGIDVAGFAAGDYGRLPPLFTRKKWLSSLITIAGAVSLAKSRSVGPPEH